MTHAHLLVQEDEGDQDVQDSLADEVRRPLVGRLLAQRVGELGVEVAASAGREPRFVLDDLRVTVQLEALKIYLKERHQIFEKLKQI